MKRRGVIAASAAALLCGILFAAAQGCGQLTCDFDEEWRAASDPGSPKVNPDNYERVKEGMTYEEVAVIFEGPGYCTMEYTRAGRTDRTFKWIGLDDYVVSVTFREGVVRRKNSWVRSEDDSEETGSGETAAEEAGSVETAAAEDAPASLPLQTSASSLAAARVALQPRRQGRGVARRTF